MLEVNLNPVSAPTMYYAALVRYARGIRENMLSFCSVPDCFPECTGG